MKAKNQLLGIATGVSMLLASCQKDLTAPEQQATLAQDVASDASMNDVVETAPPNHTMVYANVNANVAGFWQTVPALYNQTTKKYPLIIFIHGIGELGTNLSRMNCCGLPHHAYTKTFPAKFTVGGVNYSFIVMSPQFKVRPSAADMQSVINYARSRFRVDETRIYITGLSMGGGSTWDYSAVYGQNVAAAVPVCGGTRPNTTLARNIASKNLPVWTISSSGDAVVPIQWAKDWISWIDAANPSIASKTKLTVWTAEDHNATWARAFNPATRVDGYNIYEWMLLFKRGTVAAPAPTPTPTPAPTPAPSGNLAPSAYAGPDQTVPASYNYLRLNATGSTDADGYIKAVSWRMISGPSTPRFANANAANTTLSGFVAGTYVFRATVTDNDNAVSTDDVTITMTGAGGTTSGGSTGTGSVSVPGDVSPIAYAGADIRIPLAYNYARLNATQGSRDPDGYLTSFTWTQISGPSTVSIANRYTGNTTTSGYVRGTYVFRVAAKDNRGAVSTDDVTVTVY